MQRLSLLPPLDVLVIYFRWRIEMEFSTSAGSVVTICHPVLSFGGGGGESGEGGNRWLCVSARTQQKFNAIEFMVVTRRAHRSIFAAVFLMKN